MKAIIVSLESFQKGEVPEEVLQFIQSQKEEPFIILDESSKIKTNQPCKETKKSKRTQAILKLNTIGERCILTGTFTSKTPLNAYDQMNFLKKGFFPESMYAFAERYEVRRNLPTRRGARILLQEKDYKMIRNKLLKCHNQAMLDGCKRGIMSFYGIDSDSCDHILANPEYTPFKHLDELWQRIGDNCLKVERKQVFDLPPRVVKTYNVELSKEQKKLYLELQKTNCTDNITVDNGLMLYLRFQDICNGYEPVETEESTELKQVVELIPLQENPKLDMLEEVIEEIGDNQIVVWCSRTKLLNDAEKRIREKGYTTGIYDGKIPKDLREKNYQDFADKKIQVLFMNQASGAYGLDNLKEADYAIYLSNSYSVEQREQSEYRTDRGGSTRTKYIYDITCKGTCEDRVVKALQQGKELLSKGTTDSSLFRLENA